MVKQRKENTKKKRNGKGFKENGAQARKINASTVYSLNLSVLCDIEYQRFHPIHVKYQ